MELLALNFRYQCTQQKLQSICAVVTFDPQLSKILTFSVKDRYQLNYFICIKDFKKSRDLADENNKNFHGMEMIRNNRITAYHFGQCMDL
jgi:excinuclease UvrABC nuclease subunit